VLVEGVIAPELALIVSPAVEEYLPPEVPVLVTGCVVVRLLQKGVPAYEMVAAGKVVIVIVLVAVTMPQPASVASMEFVTV
jgi:hypothetical protein